MVRRLFVQKFPMSPLNAPKNLPLEGDGEHKLGLHFKRVPYIFQITRLWNYFPYILAVAYHCVLLPGFLGKIEGGRRRGRQRMRWLDGITDSMDVSLSELGVGDGQGGLACCDSWGRKESDTTERLN